MKEMIAIVNPRAGKGTGADIAEKVRARFKTSGIELEMIETNSPNHATQIAQQCYQKGHKDFVCMGGDGTLYETINGLFLDGKPEGVNLAIVPIGTGNSFLKDFDQHSRNLADKIIQNNLRPCDVIETIHTQGKLHWVNIFSFGFTSKVGATRNRKFPNIGTIGYTFSVFLELKRLSSFPVALKLDGRTINSDATFISINNTRYTGGNMMMAPDAKPDDGLLDIIEVQKMGRMELIKAFPKIFEGTHTSLPKIKTYKAQHIEFSFDQPLDIMIDGEMKNIQPISMNVIPGAIRIYA
ncbi:MAG: diacylglycerol kinase family lipid kinase [Proteobacteria bacterium]|jgi:diacylglycerol kinase (ATP)|nr:diacylglycerol kinase family lipid kinase [Pseudomonadota bacterium]